MSHEEGFQLVRGILSPKIAVSNGGCACPLFAGVCVTLLILVACKKCSQIFIFITPIILEFYHIAPQFSINYNNNFVLDKIYKLEDLDSSTFLKDEFNITNNVIQELKHHNNCSISENNIKDAFKLNHEQLLLLKQTKKIPHYKCFFNEDIKKKVEEIYKIDIDILYKFNINYFF